MNMADTIAPKSDQLNADDLIAGPRTIMITRVSGNEGNPEQPVNVFFDGDGGKPFRPCKSMRRVMVAVWGPDAGTYPGRSMTIFRDPSVAFGGMQVGGIRISHMSHLDKPVTMALTATKAKRSPYKVEPLKVAPPPTAAPASNAIDAASVAAQRGTEAFRAWWAGANAAEREAVKPHIAQMKTMAEQADLNARDDPFTAADGPDDLPIPDFEDELRERDRRALAG